VFSQGRLRPAKAGWLVVITHDVLPDILLRLKLQDVYGIGARMEERLNRAGISTVAQLWEATPHRLRRVWAASTVCCFIRCCTASIFSRRHPGSRRAWAISMCSNRTAHEGRGAEFRAALADQGGRAIAARRLFLPRLGLHLSWLADLGSWWSEINSPRAAITGFLLGRLDQLWTEVPAYKPLSVGVVLARLVPAAQHQPDLFAADHKHQKLSP